MQRKYFFLITVIASQQFLVCCEAQHQQEQVQASTISDSNKNPYSQISAIPLPEGYTRISQPQGSFGEWLRQLALKADRRVFLYNGNLKANQDAQFAVIDISVGDQNLQQCADAAMRLRAEYLAANNRFSEINFKDNEGKNYPFSGSFTKDNWQKYLNQVFSYCGSASLNKQLKPVIPFTQIQPGHLLINPGFPGHVVTVMDVAQNKNGDKIYLLSQSYMPAQDVHILKNPISEALSPWYHISEKEEVITPEYRFFKSALKRW
ncbi:MAG: DUF4846 domain-containing protein [Sphingobacteriales bacterium]|nr:DUF4846 domain-containing protein [Sphingobacteriales bacterium]